MRGNKTVFRVALAVLLVGFMACFPMLAALWQDHRSLGTPSLGYIQTVELNIREELSGLGLLAMMDSKGTWQSVTPTAASMTAEEVEQAALDVVQSYQEAGLIDASHTFRPHLLEPSAVTTSKGLGGIVWHVTLVHDMGDINLTLDDATGHVLYFGCGTEDPIPAGKRSHYMETFASLFFGQLGIRDYAQAAVDDLDNSFVGESTLARRYRFSHETYGEIHVDLYVYQHGFFTNFNS